MMLGVPVIKKYLAAIAVMWAGATGWVGGWAGGWAGGRVCGESRPMVS